MKNLLPLILIATTLLLIISCSTFTNAQFSRTQVYNVNNKCSTTTQPLMDIYLQASTCTPNENCTAHPTLNTYSYTTKCATSVPTTVPSKTFMLAVYSDNTCDVTKTTMAQFLPIDTCVAIAGTGSYKSTGCKTLSIYSDSECKTTIQTVDYSAFNGVCNEATKFICNGASIQQMMGMSLMIVVGLLVSLIF